MGQPLTQDKIDAIGSLIRSLVGVIRASGPKAKFWFLGRDCDEIFEAVRPLVPTEKVGYISGLSRGTSQILFREGRLRSWLMSFGVRNGHTLVDTGFAGSIIARVRSSGLDVDGILLSGSDELPSYILALSRQGSQARHAVEDLEHIQRADTVQIQGVPRARCKLTTAQERRRVTREQKQIVASLRRAALS